MSRPEQPSPGARQRPDMSSFWMPFTANRQFKAKPRLLVGANNYFF